MLKKLISLIGLILLLALLPSNLQAENLSTTTCPGAGCLTIPVQGSGSISIQITGTWVGTITFRSTLDNSTYTSFKVVSIADTSSTQVTTTTANGIFQGTLTGVSQIRVVFTAYTSGTAVVTLRPANQAAKFFDAVGGSGSVTSIATTSPISGGTITTTGTISCPTCTTGSGTANQLALWSSSSALTTFSNGSSGQVLTSNGASAPSFQALPAAGIGGSIAADQVAVGSGVNTIAGYTPFIWTGTGIGLYSNAETLTGGGAIFESYPDIQITSNSDAGARIAFLPAVTLNSHTLNSFIGIDVGSDLYGPGSVGIADGARFHAYLEDGLTVTTSAAGVAGDLEIFPGAIAVNPASVYGQFGLYGGTVTGMASAFYAAFYQSAVVTIPSTAGYYAQDMSASSANPYPFWSDEQGVFRIRADNTFDSVYQAIPALYNPQFTKYTPGAANYERIILSQWNGNVAEIGTEKGGTGVLRPLRLIGDGVTAEAVYANQLTVTGLTTPTNKPVCFDASGNLYAGTNTAGVLSCP